MRPRLSSWFLSGTALLLIAGLSGCGDGGSAAPTHPASKGQAFIARGLTAEIPAGWDATSEGLSQLSDPGQLLTAASYDLSPGGEPARGGGCLPQAALDLEPPGGALLAVTSYSPSHLSPAALRRLPARPGHLRLTPASYRTYECSGTAYDLQFREHGRAYKIDVWTDPKRVDPKVRADAIRLLNSLEFPSDKSGSAIADFQAALVSPTAVRLRYRLRRASNLALVIEGTEPNAPSGAIPFDAKGNWPDPARSPSTSPTGPGEVRIHFERGEYNFEDSRRLRFSIRASSDGQHDQAGPATLNREGLFGRSQVERALR